MRAGLFLDRDGVLIEHVHHLHCVDDVRLMAGAASAVRLLNDAKIPVMLITNQSVVARGLCTETELQTIHRHIEALLTQSDARLDAIYYCPHYPPGRLSSGNLAYQIECHCRKPQIGMIEQACAEWSLDLAQSALIGDSTSDIEAARRANMMGVLVRTGIGGSDQKFSTKPNYIAQNISEAVAWFLQH